MQGLGARQGDNREAWENKEAEVVNTQGTCAANRCFIKGQGEGKWVLRMG